MTKPDAKQPRRIGRPDRSTSLTQAVVSVRSRTAQAVEVGKFFGLSDRGPLT
jgi:hypothetical protein